MRLPAGEKGDASPGPILGVPQFPRILLSFIFQRISFVSSFISFWLAFISFKSVVLLYSLFYESLNWLQFVAVYSVASLASPSPAPQQGHHLARLSRPCVPDKLLAVCMPLQMASLLCSGPSTALTQYILIFFCGGSQSVQI